VSGSKTTQNATGKALSLAASALERLHATKSRALGLDKENALLGDLPVLVFRDLNSTELEAFNKRDEEEDELSGSIVPAANTDTDSALSESDESDDIVEEGVKLDEEEALEKPRSAATIALGGKLVRGQLP
jgi:hypothetical protein